MKPFNVEAAKIGKKVVTRSGDSVEFIAFNAREPYPIIGYIDDSYHLSSWDKDGRFDINDINEVKDPIISNHDLFMANEEKRYDFKPFDIVLVRDKPITDEPETGIWSSTLQYFADQVWWQECIPYKGNEHLLGTSKTP